MTFLHVCRWLVSVLKARKDISLQANPDQTYTDDVLSSKRRTSSFPVVLEHLTQDQFVGVFAERIPEHCRGDEIHVTVGAFRLIRAGTIKIPFRNI